MSAVTGLTKDGKESKHTLANTGPRRFLICEFDTGTADEHAAILIHLAGYAPLVCAVTFGGKAASRLVLRSRPARRKSVEIFPLRREFGRGSLPHGHAANSSDAPTARATTANARRFISPISNQWRPHYERIT